jgi:hypothetical protein
MIEEVAILLYIIQNIMIPSAILPAHVAVALDRFRIVDGACDLSLLALTADYATYGRTDSLPRHARKLFLNQYFRKFIILNGNKKAPTDVISRDQWR